VCVCVVKELVDKLVEISKLKTHVKELEGEKKEIEGMKDMVRRCVLALGLSSSDCCVICRVGSGEDAGSKPGRRADEAADGGGTEGAARVGAREDQRRR